MVQINFAQRQVNAKIVYYGPGMSGKTTNLEVIHQRAPDQNRGDLTSISTDGDRTLFFDFMPLDLGTVAGMRTCFQIYTVPGQVYYNSTRKLVLQGVDGVVFVADSSASMVEDNLESLRNLEENLNEYGKSLATMPHVIQFNKRDLPDALPPDQLNQVLNLHGAPTYEAVASTGQGVFPTLKALAACVLETIHQGSKGAPSAGAASNQPAPRTAPPPSLPSRAAAAPAQHAVAGQGAPTAGIQSAAQGAPPRTPGIQPMAGGPQAGAAHASRGPAMATPQRAPTAPQPPHTGYGVPPAPHQQAQGGSGAGLHLRPRPAQDLPASSPSRGTPPARTPQQRRPASRGTGQGQPQRATRGKAKSLEGTRFRPRTSRPSPRATPARRGNTKLVAGVVVALSLVVGAVLAQVVFSLF